MNGKYEEVRGENQNEPLKQFVACPYIQTKTTCRYRDMYGRCTLENCILDQQETAPTTKKWWFKCIICGHPTALEPEAVRVPICESCISRMNDAEVLPFTCRYCGKKQYTPSQWMFSKVCDECIPKLYSPNCDNYSQTGSFSISSGGNIKNVGTFVTNPTTHAVEEHLSSTKNSLSDYKQEMNGKLDSYKQEINDKLNKG